MPLSIYLAGESVAVECDNTIFRVHEKMGYQVKSRENVAV